MADLGIKDLDELRDAVEEGKVGHERYITARIDRGRQDFLPAGAPRCSRAKIDSEIWSELFEILREN